MELPLLVLLSLITCLLAVAAFGFLRRLSQPPTSRKIPVVPAPSFLFGHLKTESTGWHVWNTLAERYGPFYCLHYGLLGRMFFKSPWIVVISDIRAAHAVLKTRNRGDTMRLARRSGEATLVTDDGDAWALRRKLAHPTFTTSSVRAYYPLLAEVVRSAVDRISGENGSVRNVEEIMGHLSLDAIGVTAFGRSFDAVSSKNSPVADAIRANCIDLQALSKNPLLLLGPLGTRLEERIKVVRDVARRCVQEAAAQAGPHVKDNLLTRLLRANREDGDRMSEKDVVVEMGMLIGAGHETTARTMTWALHCLATHPGWLVRLQEELDAVCGDRPMPKAEEMVSATTPVLFAVLLETNRLYPPFPQGSSRELDRPVDVYLRDGTQVTLPEGTLVRVPSVAVNHSRELWGEDAAQWNPQRWLDKPEWLDHPPKHFLTFGAGARECMGKHLANAESHLAIAALARRFSWRHCPTRHPGGKVDMVQFITLKPLNGLWLQFQERGKGWAVAI